jgi:hypothetical protein
MTGATRTRSDWFSGRKDHFLRQLLDEAMALIGRFYQLYDRYRRVCAPPQEPSRACTAPGTPRTQTAIHAEVLTQLTAMVGSETSKGPLWQLKDQGHQIWPRHAGAPPSHGMLLDWLIGALFHEAVTLKEHLYLRHRYGSVVTIMPTPALLQEYPGWTDGTPDNVDHQMERVGSLFSQVNYLIRLMLPDLIANPLVIRLLAEREDAALELWGEPLESIFTDMFAGSPETGFCWAGASYGRGQWFRRSLEMYERALACNRQCSEARVRVAHLRAILHEGASTERENNEGAGNP